MKCPICQQEMQEGGLIARGDTTICWTPLEQFQKKGLGKVAYLGVKPLKNASGAGDFVFGLARVPGAYYCAHCNKVTGVFDVEQTVEP